MRRNLKLEPDAIGFGNIQNLHHLPSDTIDPLDIIFGSRPQLYPIHLASQTNDSAANLVTLIQVFPNQRHGEPVPAAVQ